MGKSKYALAEEPGASTNNDVPLALLAAGHRLYATDYLPHLAYDPDQSWFGSKPTRNYDLACTTVSLACDLLHLIAADFMVSFQMLNVRSRPIFANRKPSHDNIEMTKQIDKAVERSASRPRLFRDRPQRIYELTEPGAE